MKNARLIGANCNLSNNNGGGGGGGGDYIDEDYSDYVVKHDIPEMKLLPMDYVPKPIKPSCAPPPPPTKCKCAPEPPVKPPVKPPMKVTISEPIAVEKNPSGKLADRYLVYKRKHGGIFGATTPEKLRYVNGNANKKILDVNSPEPPKPKENRKKYLIFDSKKSSSKLDSIQYYFDNKSYEQYVDNKLYGKINRPSSAEPRESSSDVDLMKGFEHSRSWEYRDNTKTETRLKLFESKSHDLKKTDTAKSDGSSNSTSGASSSSEISLKRRNCRLKPHLRFTTSKSIGDLTQRTSHDVDRINQLFANAKPAVMRSDFEREKYKIHRKLNGDSGVIESVTNTQSEKALTKDNLKKYHRSTTELNIKAPASPTSCGFKNCKLSVCPVSNSASSVVSAPLVNERRSRFDENFIKKFEDMRKNSSTTAMLRNNEITVNKTNISVNGIIVNDTRGGNNFTANAHDVYIVDKSKEKEFHSKPNNQNKTTIKINDSCFVVDTNNHHDVKINNNERSKNIIELNSEKTTNWDKNIKVKNNPQPKYYDNKVNVNNKIRNEENSVKIYVTSNDSSSPTPSARLSISSSQDSSDSDKDYGYFDTSSQGRSSSPEFAEMFKKFRQMCNQNSSNNTLGCDGALFWNNSYFDEEEADAMLTALNKKTERKASASVYACTKCHTTTEDLLSNYICICRNQVIMHFIFALLLLIFSGHAMGEKMQFTASHATKKSVIKIAVSEVVMQEPN